MRTDILILDGNNLAHRCYHSLAKLNNRGKPVGVIYGLPNLVGSLVKKFQPKRVYLVWDGRKSHHRMKILPSYKLRKPHPNFDPDDFYLQRTIVMHLFRALGVKQIYAPKREADDQIALLVKKFKGRKTLIVSNDKDFHQLISPTLSVYNAKNVVLTPKNLKSEFGYSPDQCVDYLCLVGDDSDKIPGYPGIGPVRARDFFLEHSSIDNFMQSNKKHKLIDKVKLEAIYAINRQLIDLNFYMQQFMKGKKARFWLGIKKPQMNVKAIDRISDEYFIRRFKKKSFQKIWQ